MIDVPRNFSMPSHIVKELLIRWSEPHRQYHGLGHLYNGLRAIEFLGGNKIEKIAYQFHDIVHTCSTPLDEIASAKLAEKFLKNYLNGEQIEEIQRLIMLTAHDGHPALEDQAGRRIRDADLSSLAADWEVFMHNNRGIRNEKPMLSDYDWATQQGKFINNMLGRERIFLTDTGHQTWEKGARENLNSLQEHLSKWALRRGRTPISTV